MAITTRTLLITLLLLIVLPSVHAVLTTNLTRYYDGDGAACETERVAGIYNLDANNSATCSSTIWQTSPRAFNVSNTGDKAWYANATGLPIGAASRSMFCWVYPRALNANNNVVMAYGTVGAGQTFDMGIQANGSLMFLGDTVPYDFYGGGVVPLNTWSMVGVTYDGTYVRTYNNATNTGNKSIALNTVITNPKLWIGRQNAYNNQDPDAYIDGCGIWNYTLNQTEITELYGAGPYPFVSGTQIVTVGLTNRVNGTNWPLVTFTNVTGTLSFAYYNITTTGYCVTLTGNGTRTNCTAGNGASAYYNVTNNSLSITTTQNVSASTFQNLLNMTVRRLFLNTTIQTFNATTNQATNQTGTGNTLLPGLTSANLVRVDTPGNYSVNTTCTPASALTTIECNVTGVYDALIKVNATLNGPAVTTFTAALINTTFETITSTTTNGSAYLRAIQGYAFNITINATGASLAATNHTPTNKQPNVTFALLSENTFNLTFYNESTNTILTGVNITVELISGPFANNYSTTNGTLQVSLLVPADYTIRYANNPSVPRDYYVTLTNQSFQNLNLYIVDEEISNLYLPIIVDQSGVPQSECTIKLLRYYVTPNGYITVEMTKTDTNGQGVLRVVPNIINYKLIVTCGASTLTTTPQKYTASTNTFTINTQANPLAGYFSYQGATTNLTYNNATLTYVLTWDDPESVLSGACLLVSKTEQNGTKTLVNNNCIGGASGSLIYTITDTNNTLYAATGLFNSTSEYSTHFIGPLIQSFKEDWQNFGLTGVLLTLFVVLFVTFMSLGNTDRTVISGAIGILIMVSFGFIAGTWTSVIGILIIAFIIAYKTRSG